MQRTPKGILWEVLEIIGYQDDKDAFADEFIQNCEKQAFIDVIATFTPQRQEEIKQKLNAAIDAEQIGVRAYISPEAYHHALQQASKNALTGLIETVLPSLSHEQAIKLQTYLQSIVA